MGLTLSMNRDDVGSFTCLNESLVSQDSEDLEQAREPPDVQPFPHEEQINWEAGDKIQCKPASNVMDRHCLSPHNQDLRSDAGFLQYQAARA